MADAQITVIDGDQTQVVLAPGENPAIVASIPGPQGPAGAVAAAIDGSAALPSIAFASDTDTGLYRAGANQLGVSTGGTQRLVIDETGQIEAASLGTQAAPTWTFVGDPNTGIYSPGADQLALSTNGNGRVFIDSSGRVGIGNGAPGWLLSLRQDTASSSTGAYPVVQINNANATGYAGLYLNDSAAQAGLETRRDTAHLGFYAGGSEKARLDSSGQLGLGILNPATALHTVGTVRISRSDSTGQYLNLYSSGGEGFIDAVNSNSGTSQAIIFRSGNSSSTAERLRITSTGQLSHIGAGSSGSPAVSFSGSAPSNSLVIDSSGRAGLGTSSPTESFHTTGALRVTGTQTTAGTGIYLDQTAGAGSLSVYGPDNSTQGTFRIYTATANGGIGSAKLSVDSSGRVGIGTSSPAGTLHLAATYPLLYLTDTDATGSARSAIGSPDGNLVYYANENNQTGGSHIFYRNGANESVRIDSSGRVGIGTTSPSERLHVAGTTLAYGNGAAPFRWGNTSSVGTLTYSGDDALIQTSSGSASLVFLRSSAETARIDGSGRLLVGTASVPTGTNSQYSKFVVAGNSANSISGYISIGTASSSASYATGTEIGLINFTDNGAGEFASIRCATDAACGAGDFPGRLVFSTTADGASSPTERMRITNNGAVWLNTTTGTVGTTTFGTVFAGDGVGSFRTSRNVNGVDHVAIVSGNVGLFVVRGDGDCENTNNSYGALSDIKLKENIVDASSQWNDISALQVRNYNFKAETGYNTHTQIGLVAQEVELVSPGLVSESPDRDEDGNDLGTTTKSVNYSVLYMKAVKALQEAMERIEILEAKVAALEAS